MKRFVRLIVGFLLLFIILSTLFFMWASSPQISEKQYSQLITNNYEEKIDTDSVYSIVTYNIGYLSGMTNNKAVNKPRSLFDTNLRKVNHLFDSLSADIIALQEIDYNAARSYNINQQNELAKLGYNYVAQAVNWDERYVPFPYWPPSVHFGEMLSGQSVLSKFPISLHERIVLERVTGAPFYRDALYLERLAQVVKITIENTEVIIINIHLEAFDKPTRANQFTYVIDLFKKYAENYPTLLVGDFNSQARDENAVIKELLEMPAIGNAAFNKNDISNTFNSKDPFKRIDYIFYTKNSIVYTSGKILNEFGEASDHLPVYMEFRLKQANLTE